MTETPFDLAPIIDELRPIYDQERTINFTITFGRAYSNQDTIWLAPKKVNDFLVKMDFIEQFYIVKELHANKLRSHLHGQCLLKMDLRENQILYFQNLSRNLFKSFGITDMKWNDVGDKEDSDYPSYTHYCFKENKEPLFRHISKIEGIITEEDYIRMAAALELKRHKKRKAIRARKLAWITNSYLEEEDV